MAVQKRRRTRSTRGMRRGHDKLGSFTSSSTLSIDSETGETHRRHHVTSDGYYRGRLVVESRSKTVESEAVE